MAWHGMALQFNRVEIEIIKNIYSQKLYIHTPIDVYIEVQKYTQFRICF